MGFIKQFLEPFVRNMKNFALITRFYTQDGRFVRIVAMHRGKYRPRQPEIMVTLRTVFIDITSHHPFLYNIYSGFGLAYIDYGLTFAKMQGFGIGDY